MHSLLSDSQCPTFANCSRASDTISSSETFTFSITGKFFHQIIINKAPPLKKCRMIITTLLPKASHNGR